MCLNPKWIYKKGQYKENTYRGFKDDFYEIGTYSKCGHCVQCVAEKCNNWVIRNYYESKIHQKKCFITLTYEENPYILIRKDFQNFMKRLRRNLEKQGYTDKIRMFMAGEYGTLKGRPHGHIIIYGWEDENKKYLGINKKGNILYKSDLIQKTWKKGRTSYQTFNDHEAPYIALYDTAKENFKKAYLINQKKLKFLENYSRTSAKLNEETRKNLIEELKIARYQLEESKGKYYAIKEFNGWSIALGWNQFYEEYSIKNEYTWQEYIEDKIFVTPTPWVKKLANMGDIEAAKEMFKREEEIIQASNELQESINNQCKVNDKTKKERKKWIEELTKNGGLDEL